MKKGIFSLMLLVMIATNSFAKIVSSANALRVAQNFFFQQTGKVWQLLLTNQSNNTDASDGIHVGEPLYYVFTADRGAGFVIIAADDAIKPVLGYSFTNSFSIEHAPPVITDWLAKYGSQIIDAKKTGLLQTDVIAKSWNDIAAGNHTQLKSASATGPLLTTAWDQDLYYNAQCPSDVNSPSGYGGNVPTGCGATAMSQIMKYWGYPAQGTGSNGYNSGYGHLTDNFAAHTYNWANMPNSVTSPNNDVATIMYDCGVAVNMNYEAQESLSYMTGAAPSCQDAYITYFGYDPNTIQGLLKVNYANEGDWLNLIQNELVNNRPVQYAGSGAQGGHTFVLDGSDGNGNFHINWGWSGADNGYYGIDALDPAPYANGNFDQNESMIIGIQPLNVVVPASGIELYVATTVSPNPIGFLQTFTVSTNLINNGTSAFNGSYCAALFDVSGNFIRYIGDILSTNGSPLPVGYYYNSNLTFSDTTQAVTVPGNYTIGIYYQTSGSNTWTLAGASTFVNPITVTVSGPQDAIDLFSNIVASPATLQQGQQATVSANLINNGAATYTGQYEAVLLDLYGNFVQQIGTYTESAGLPVGYAYNSPLSFSTNNVTAAEGQYILAIAENASGTSNWYYCGGQTYQNPVLIDVVNPGINVLAINQVQASHISVYPNPASSQITIDASGQEGGYELQVFNLLGQQMHISNGMLATGQKIETDVSSFAQGIYTVRLKLPNGILTTNFVVN